MFKKFVLAVGIGAIVALAVPSSALASRTIAGRITAYTPSSLSVVDKETVTVGLDSRTVVTKLITQKPWQENTQLDASALAVGRFVSVRVAEWGNVAEWVQVQVATDLRNFASSANKTGAFVAPAFTTGNAEADAHLAMAMAYRRSPNASESKRPGSAGTAAHCERRARELVAGSTPIVPGASVPVAPGYAAVGGAAQGDILTAAEVRDLIANAKTAADHRKLSKHFAALAAKYEAEATEHTAEAEAYRKAPNAAESKRPGHPDTAAHCDRLAKAAREAATAAKSLAGAHEHMAASK